MKEGNGDHKYLRCPYLQDRTFKVLYSEIALDKVDLECAETVQTKPTGNYSGFISYSNTINFSSKWLNNSGYLITRWKIIVKGQAVLWLKHFGIIKKVTKVGEISERNDILTVQ